MQIKFSKNQEYTPTWRDNRELPIEEQVKVIIHPLQMADLVKLIDGLNKAGAGKVDEETLVSDGGNNLQSIKQMVEEAGDLIPKYCEIKNLSNDDGSPIDAQEIVTYPFYLEFAAELLTELANVSMPNEAETKNLKMQPGSP